MILVTGASGFLGQHLVRRLSAGAVPVRALYYRNPPDELLRSLPNVSWMPCDLLDVFAVEQAFEGITTVYHCAAKVSFEAADQYHIQQVNTESTANVVNTALEAGIRKLLFVSSIATLGRGNLDKPLSENDFWEESKNNTAYARSKYLAEMEVWRGMAEGLNAVIVNPAIILGPGKWSEGSARLMQIADREFPFYTEGVNGWVGVHDVVSAMIQLMGSDIAEERFIICEGNHAYREIFTLMARALGRKPPSIKAPGWATGLLWRWNALRKAITGKKATVTKETTRTAQMKCCYNNEKLLQALPGFRYTPIEQVIGAMASAFIGEKPVNA
ncbi:MAG: NAD-dependent epimerase/dehydratase family protein [Chitinophagaceae bacterium]|nr:NAD-dependent epimerase/dehydratase family protein [Chitinophagaceae bacterium]